MDNEINNLLSITIKLMRCSNDNCVETENKINKDVKLLQEIAKLTRKINQKKINALLSMIYKNKLVVENNKCVLNHCLNINK